MLEGEVLLAPSQAIAAQVIFMHRKDWNHWVLLEKGNQIRSQTSQVLVPPPLSDLEQFQTSLASIASKACDFEIQPF